MKYYLSKETLETALKEYKSIKNTARQFHVNEKTIARLCKDYDIQSSIGTQGARKHHCDETYFSIINTQEKAYWLGFIYADGCVYRGTDKYSYRLQINLCSDDKNHLKTFLNAIKGDYLIRDKIYKTSFISELKINSTALCQSLIKQGVTPRKSLVCVLPHLNESLMRHFIRGYFDGDGCMTHYRRNENSRLAYSIKIVGGLEMLDAIKEKLLCKTYLYQVRNTAVFSLETGSADSVQWIYNYFYQDCTICLERKKNKFEYVLSHLAGMPSKEQSELRERANDLTTTKQDE